MFRLKKSGKLQAAEPAKISNQLLLTNLLIARTIPLLSDREFSPTVNLFEPLTHPLPNHPATR
ncbi:hypothetical protein DSO57_1006206 [Entomophthora muscae]|uniref:Uncharacterized protein n=1 Tax=Entomophthora muscae TaxID=34485 RepID=A0ACC2S9Q7_9FUNG|nr:hypothetical protein DSO57_1006206 [Entomophthora muscae]